MHELAFADSVRPARGVILFLPMLRYSVGHELLLLQERNGLLLTGFDSLPDGQKSLALVRAADVCSQSWTQNHFTPRSWWAKRQVGSVWDKWQQAINRGVGSGAPGETRPTTWAVEIAKMRDYIRAGSTSPPTEACDGPAGRQFGAPFHASLIQFLISQMDCTEVEAYDYPFGLAKFHYYSHAESEGSIRVVNAPEMEFEEFCARKDAEAEVNAEAQRRGDAEKKPEPETAKEVPCQP